MRTLAALLLLSALSASASDGVWVGFWTTDVKPPDGVQVLDHPCGTALWIKTDVVPSNGPWLEADVMHEIDGSGKILRTWNVPIDHYPVGVDGDKVLLAYGSNPGTVLAVALNGRLSVIPAPPSRFLGRRECPAPFNEQFFCDVLVAEPLRMLAYLPVCT